MPPMTLFTLPLSTNQHTLFKTIQIVITFIITIFADTYCKAIIVISLRQVMIE